MHSAVSGQLFVGESDTHVFDVIGIEAKGLEVREAVVGLAKIRAKLNCTTVGCNTTRLITDSLKHMA